jgi:hypothetical protein
MRGLKQGAEVSLSGNLGFVSLDEVLRLLTRSKQRGAVDVRGEKVRGRVFVDRGGVALATTFTDDSLHRHLVKSGLVDAAQLQTVQTGSKELTKLPDVDEAAVTALLREMSVESIYQLGLQGETFEVSENETSPYASSKPFELEDILTDSKQRLTDWAEVTAVVSDLDRSLRFRKDLAGREQVTIAKDAWRVLSEVGPGSSVRHLADELGTTEFWTARVAAGLIEEDLLTLEPTPVVEEPAAAWAPEETLVETPAEPPAEEPAPEPASVGYDTSASAEVDPNQSWWREPEEEATPADEAPTEETPVFQPEEEPVPAAAAAVDQTWAEPQGVATEPERQTTAVATDATGVEEDTEAFLEKVFSDMEPTEETEEGYGLLRRRRMGVLRDLSNES